MRGVASPKSSDTSQQAVVLAKGPKKKPGIIRKMTVSIGKLLVPFTKHQKAQQECAPSTPIKPPQTLSFVPPQEGMLPSPDPSVVTLDSQFHEPQTDDEEISEDDESSVETYSACLVISGTNLVLLVELVCSLLMALSDERWLPIVVGVSLTWKIHKKRLDLKPTHLYPVSILDLDLDFDDLDAIDCFCLGGILMHCLYVWVTDWSFPVRTVVAALFLASEGW